MKPLQLFQVNRPGSPKRGVPFDDVAVIVAHDPAEALALSRWPDGTVTERPDWRFRVTLENLNEGAKAPGEVLFVSEAYPFYRALGFGSGPECAGCGLAAWPAIPGSALCDCCDCCSACRECGDQEPS